MRSKDIQVGGEYYTYVSGARVKVRVTHDRGKPGAYQHGRYQVQRVDTGQYLPKWRSAQALHPAPVGPWPGMTQKQETIEEGFEIKKVEDLQPGDVIKGKHQQLFEVRDTFRQEGVGPFKDFYKVYVVGREEPYRLRRNRLLKVRRV